MAVKSKETLKTQSAETFYDNDLGGITPADHRQFNEDLIDSMATVAQGNKADTAIQGVRVSGSFLPTTTVGGKNIVDWSNGPATAAQGKKAETAIQAATIGGETVPKSGTTLQLPAYPTVPQMDVMRGASPSIPFRETTIYHAVFGNMLFVMGGFVGTGQTVHSGMSITIPGFYRMTMGAPFRGAIVVGSGSKAAQVYQTTISTTTIDGEFGLKIEWNTTLLLNNLSVVLMPIIIPLVSFPPKA